MSTEQGEVAPASNEEQFALLDTYPWDKDAEFQRALKALLGTNPTPSQKETNTIRARCYYYERKKGVKVDFNTYYAHIQSLQASASSPSDLQSQPIPQAESLLQSTSSLDSNSLSSDSQKEESTLPTEQSTKYPTKFAEVVAMIQSGTPIPGIKEIPTTVLSDKVTQSTVGRRRKPWEKVVEIGEENQNADADGAIGGTFGDNRTERPLAQDLPEGLMD